MFTWIVGAQIFGWNGFRMQVYNPPARMFATKETADRVAEILGLKAFEAPAGAFGSYSHPLYMVNRTGDPMAAAACAGMVADVLDRYGDKQGSRGYELAQRDIGMIEGAL